MKRLLTVLLLLLVLSGCLPATSVLESTQNAEIEQLKQQNITLAEKVLELQEQNLNLDKQIEVLQEEKAALENQLSQPQIKPEEEEDQVKKEELINLSNEVLLLVSGKEYAALAEYVHPEKGLRFTPAGYIRVDEDLVFAKNQVTDFSEDSTIYTWGIEPGRGNPISLDVDAYWDKYVYNSDFLNAYQVLFNQVGRHSSTINNFSEVYSEGWFVEYYLPGTQTYGFLDWYSLRLAWEQTSDGSYTLVGLIHDFWTP